MSWQSIIKMFLDYNGRLSREAFVVAYGSLLFVSFVLSSFYFLSENRYFILFSLFIFIFFWWIPVQVFIIKRFHDLNLPGGYFWIFFTLLFVLLFWSSLFFPDHPFFVFFSWSSLFSPDHPFSYIMSYFTLICLLDALLLPYLTLAKGNPKINKYGEPPLPFKGPSFVLFGSYVIVGLHIHSMGFLFLLFVIGDR